MWDKAHQKDKLLLVFHVNKMLTQPTQTKEQVLQANQVAMQNIIYKEVGDMQTNIRSLFDLVWNSQDYTAQEMLDLWGTNAVSLFQAVQYATQIVQLVNPLYQPPTVPQTFQINADGTVTTPTPTPLVQNPPNPTPLTAENPTI